MEVVAALCPAPASLTSEKILEDIVEGVAEAGSAESEALRSRTLLSPGMAEHVIAFTFVLIAQRLIGFIDFFELFFRRFLLGLPRLEVGMVLACHLSIGLLELVFGRGSLDT